VEESALNSRRIPARLALSRLELYRAKAEGEVRLVDDSTIPLDRIVTRSRIGVISLCRAVSTSEPSSSIAETASTMYDAWIVTRSLRQRIWKRFRFMMTKKRNRGSAAKFLVFSSRFNSKIRHAALRS